MSPLPQDIRFNFTCHHCGSVLEAHRSQSGTSGRCPTCAGVFVIPRSDQAAAAQVAIPSNAQPGQDPTPVHAYAAAGQNAPAIERRDDGTCQIVCPRCQDRNGIESDYCAACGFPFTLEGASRAAVEVRGGLAAAALIMSLVSLPLCLCTHLGGLGSIAAGAMAWYDLTASRSFSIPPGGRGLSRGALVLSAIGVVISLVRIASGL